MLALAPGVAAGHVAEVEAAQKEIIDVARRLAAEGIIVFGSGGEDDYV